MNLKKVICRVLFLVIAWIIPVTLHAQEVPVNPTDSMVQLLGHSTDTARIDLLISLSDKLNSSDPRQAFLYGSEALDLSLARNDMARTGMSYEALAHIYTMNAVFEKALSYSLQAMDAFESLKDTARIAHCEDHIGLIYMLANDFTNAHDYYRKALLLNKETRNFQQIAVNYMHMGQNYVKIDSVEKGLSYYTVSLLLADSLNMQKEKVDLLNYIGYGYARLGKHEDALKRFYKVLEFVGNPPDDYIRSSAMVNIARGYLNLKNYPAALKYGQNGYNLSKSKGFLQITCDAAKVLSDIYSARDDYKESYAYFVQYKDLSDSVMNLEKGNQLARIQTLYELGKTEKENAGLKIENVQSQKSLKTKTLVIIVFVILALVLAFMLYLLNKLNNKQLALNKKLAEQGKELEDLNDQKDRFFSFVAHNLKNPFNTIMGFAELMQRTENTKDKQKPQQYARLIYDLSSQVQKVLSNLLEWSRLQRRSFECKPETVELSSLVKDVLEMNTREAARKDIHFNINRQDHVVVSADRSMITTVLQNLVSNAINFTPSSGVITLSCALEDQQAVVSIADTGIGISPENLERLFSFDFSQSRMSSSDKGGAGLGLIICQEMIAKNNGTITAESEPGKGSRFTFTLPALLRDDDGELMSDQPEKESEIIERLLEGNEGTYAKAGPEIVRSLTPGFDEVTRVLSIENLEIFSKSVTDVGEEYDIAPLADYGRMLQRLTHAHQIDQIIKVLPGFRKYLDNIVQHSWN
jgi:signal transduction histidine kinase